MRAYLSGMAVGSVFTTLFILVYLAFTGGHCG